MYLRHCPKCSGKDIHIDTRNKRVVCGDCGNEVAIDSDSIAALYAKEWNYAATHPVKPEEKVVDEEPVCESCKVVLEDII